MGTLIYITDAGHGARGSNGCVGKVIDREYVPKSLKYINGQAMYGSYFYILIDDITTAQYRRNINVGECWRISYDGNHTVVGFIKQPKQIYSRFIRS